MRRPDVRKRFLLRAVLLLPLAFGFWHWAQVPVLGALLWVSEAAWPYLFPHGVSWIDGAGGKGWTLHTGWPIALSAGSAAGQKLLIQMDVLITSRMVAGFPLLFALCLATPGPRWRRMAWGAALLTAISWLALTFFAWHTLAIASGTQPSFAVVSVRPPPFAVAVEPYAAWQVYLSGYLMYLAILIIPYVTPLVLWAWLFRRFVRRLVLSARLAGRARARARS